MSYPPAWRHETDPSQGVRLMRAHPLAHLYTSHGGQRVTRIAFVVDLGGDRPARLRGHVNGANPQAEGLDGAGVLAVFSGPLSYVSPHWRIDKARGGTFDYEQVVVRGTARTVEGIEHFRRMIDDLSALIEPEYAGAGDYPVWQTSMAAPGYIERLIPHITQFVIDISEIEVISKLHQQFPEEDRRSVAEHLERCQREGSREIARRIRESL